MREFKLEDRLKLKYMDQVEFVRFYETLNKINLDISRLNLELNFLQTRKQEALDELERLLSKPVGEKPEL